MAAPSDVNETYLSSSPHFHSGSSTRKTMLTVIISLLPLCIYSIVLFGIQSLVAILTSVTSCVAFEYCFQKLTHQKVRVSDLSAIVTGILMALVLPPAMGSWSNLWRIVLASFMAIVVAKGFFGGIGANVFNPALIGRAFLVVSFPTQMTTWTMPFLANKVDAVSSATLLTQIKGGTLPAQTISNFKDYFFGLRAGCIGETAIFLILIALIFLLCTKTIDWRAPVGMVCTALTGTIIASAVTGSNIGQDILLTLLTGGLLFGATFMVTDYATTPVTKKGRLIFGIGCGLITFLIRQFSGYPEGVMFSILIMNSTVSFLNRLIGKKYGFVKKPKGGK